MKLRTIIDALPALQKLSAQDFTPKTLYRVRKLIQSLETEVKFFNDERDKVVAKYRQGGEKLTGAQLAAADAELATTLDIEVDVTFTRPQIPDSENYRLSNNDLEQLAAFVDFTFEDDAEAEGKENKT